LVNDQASKGWGEGVTMWKAVLLGKGIKGAVRSMNETKIAVFVHKVKIVDQSVEAGVGFNNIQSFFSSHLIPTVD
jgi:hypothetical protein